MSRVARAQTEIQNQLPEGETVLAVSPCQIKSGKNPQRTAKNIGIGVAASLALQSVGAGVFDAPRDGVELTDRMVAGLLREVAVINTATGEPVVRLNFGIRKNAADRIMATV